MSGSEKKAWVYVRSPILIPQLPYPSGVEKSFWENHHKKKGLKLSNSCERLTNS